MKLLTEERIVKTIPSDHPIIHWMMDYAAETINRFRIFHKKLTLREAIRGKQTLRIIAEFGNNVL